MVSWYVVCKSAVNIAVIDSHYYCSSASMQCVVLCEFSPYPLNHFSRAAPQTNHCCQHIVQLVTAVIWAIVGTDVQVIMAAGFQTKLSTRPAGAVVIKMT